MSKDFFPIHIINNKWLFISKLYISIIFLISKFYLIECVENNEVNAPYANCLQLDNNNLFIANSAGMFYCKQNLEVIKSHNYYDKNRTLEEFEKIRNKIVIAQFKEDGIIICIDNNIFYFFDEEVELKILGCLPEEIKRIQELNLVTYKKEENDYYFIIAFMDTEYKKIFFYNYKVNGNTKNYTIVSNNEYSSFYIDYPEIKIQNQHFTCQIIYSRKNKKNVLTCCFSTYNSELLVVQSFDIENNLTEIEEYYSKFPIKNLGLITSTISEDKQKMFVCYSPSNKYGYCFNYDFDNNIILNNKPYIFNCYEKYTSFKVLYIKTKQEYFFICQNEIQDYLTIIKFDNNFQKINPDDISEKNFFISNHWGFDCLSLIYDENINNYALITNIKNNSLNVPISTKIPLIINFTESISPNLSKPIDYEEKFDNGTYKLKRDNKYFIYTKNYDILVNSSNSKIIINLNDENELYINDKYNNIINNSYLYNLVISTENMIGILTVNLDGDEKIVENNQRLPIFTNLYYYPIFKNQSYPLTLNYVIYLRNKTLASDYSQITIHICRQNCTCNINNIYYCNGCIDNYVKYSFENICIGTNDLIGKFLNKDGIYYDCYNKCKTCSQEGYNDLQMNCLSCYTEYNYYLDNNNCYEKNCSNLFYRDKDTGIKTCIDEDYCPQDYPIIVDKECQQTKNEDSPSELMTQSSLGTSTMIKSLEFSTIIKPYENINSLEIEKSLITTKPKDNLNNKNISNKETLEMIKESIDPEKINQINITYPILSNLIEKGNISDFKDDITITGSNITYQLTTTENQKNSNHNSNVSVIDLGECEKIIKKNISYEDDQTPLLILKIDIKKNETTAVEYEVYNPYTREKIDLSICSDTTISIYAPVNLNDEETSLYNNLNEQGYDLFDVNDSFYIDPCSPYTSTNGTDVSLIDRKDYYYNEDIVLCEDNCKYIEVNTGTQKVYCECSVKSEVNVNGDQEFSPQKLLDNFYKVDTYANFEVLFCYKLLFSSKGIKTNACFYILLILLFCFLVSMIINLFSALKKIDDIIFKIFQDKFMYYFMQKIIMEGRKKRNAQINNNLFNINNNKKDNEEGGTKPKLGWLQKLKLAGQKKNENESNPINLNNNIIINKKDKPNLYNINDGDIKNMKIIKNKKDKKKKGMNDQKIKISESIDNKKDKLILKDKKHKKNKINNTADIDNNETNIDNKENKNNSQKKKNVKSIKINIINNIMNKKDSNPPLKKKEKKNTSVNETNIGEKSLIKEESSKKKKAQKSRKRESHQENPNSNSSVSNLPSIICLKKGHEQSKKNELKINKLFSSNKKKGKDSYIKIEEKKEEKKEIKQEEQQKPTNNIKYIDEELNRMSYEEALENDKRNYWQYYWSLLKKKHMIILTFVSNNDYNVFLLKCSLFVLSLALFFAINTLFYKDSTMHQIFTEQGKYNLIYQIPQILYSTLISFVMTYLLKKLSLSQNEIIRIKKEIDRVKAKKLATKTKKCLKIKLYSFFFIGLFLLLFFWYYISAFAAVYKNTQIHLIKDTLISFAISMSYPFLINLIPGIFRFFALKSEKHDKKCLYKTSQIIAFF